MRLHNPWRHTLSALVLAIAGHANAQIQVDVEAPGTGVQMVWTAAVPAGTVYQTFISWNNNLPTKHGVTPQLMAAVNGNAGDVFRLAVQACWGTIEAPTQCGPLSPWSLYVRLNTPRATPGVGDRPKIALICDDPTKPKAAIVNNAFVCIP